MLDGRYHLQEMERGRILCWLIKVNFPYHNTRFSPLYILDYTRKILGKRPRGRLSAAIKDSGSIAHNHYIADKQHCVWPTSKVAVLMVASINAIERVEMEVKRIYGRRQDENQKMVSSEQTKETTRTLVEWQTMWATAFQEQWTHTLIPVLNTWIARQHGDIDFFLTKLLTGHNHINSYCSRWTKRNGPSPIILMTYSAQDGRIGELV